MCTDLDAIAQAQIFGVGAQKCLPFYVAIRVTVEKPLHKSDGNNDRQDAEPIFLDRASQSLGFFAVKFGFQIALQMH